VIWNERSGLEERWRSTRSSSRSDAHEHRAVPRLGAEHRRQRIRRRPDMSTNLPGVFAAGTSSRPGKVLLITAGSGEAATAVNTAKEYISATRWA